MHPSLIPPRQVTIGDAASFVGITPRAIRHYHAIGLIPEPPRGSDDRRRYGYEEMIRLLWIRRMADAGIALEDIRSAVTDAASGSPSPVATVGVESDQDLEGILDRLERNLVARVEELERQRAAVRSMRARGSRVGLLSDLVAGRLERLPGGSLRQTDLDTLLVTEQMLGPVVAAIQATRFIALATHPELREESDRIDAAEESLDDSVAVDDPRVERIAGERAAFERELNAVIEGSGLAQEDEAFLDAWDAQHSADDADDADAGSGRGSGQPPTSAVEALQKMPYDFSPARLRCMDLAGELAASE